MTADQVEPARIKELLVRVLRLEGRAPDSIGDEQPLFGDGLGLDSVDALELVVALEAEFGIEIANEDVGRERFAHVRALADLVNENRARRALPRPGAELG
jgi:acyl carrier protein